MKNSTRKIKTDPMSINFSTFLKEYMDTNSLSQNDLADLLETSKSNISAWINRKRFPRAEQLAAIAEKLGVSYVTLTEDHRLSSDIINKIDHIQSRKEVYDYLTSLNDINISTKTKENILIDAIIQFGYNGFIELNEAKTILDSFSENSVINEQTINKLLSSTIDMTNEEHSKRAAEFEDFLDSKHIHSLYRGENSITVHSYDFKTSYEVDLVPNFVKENITEGVIMGDASMDELIPQGSVVHFFPQVDFSDTYNGDIIILEIDSQILIRELTSIDPLLLTPKTSKLGFSTIEITDNISFRIVGKVCWITYDIMNNGTK